MDGQRIAKVVLPLVVLVWLASWLTAQPWVPRWINWLVDTAIVCSILGVIVWGFRGSAWGELARRYPVRQPYTGAWTSCPTLHVSTVSADHPDYDQGRVRLVGLVRLACADDALYLAPILPLFNVLMPPVEIPLSAITQLKTFEHSGVVRGRIEPGTLLQITYDPNFRGRIADLAVGEPSVHLQLEADLIDPALAKLSARHA